MRGVCAASSDGEDPADFLRARRTASLAAAARESELAASAEERARTAEAAVAGAEQALKVAQAEQSLKAGRAEQTQRRMEEVNRRLSAELAKLHQRAESAEQRASRAERRLQEEQTEPRRSDTVQVEVLCPMGKPPGTTFEFETEWGAQSILVPPGVEAGDTFRATVRCIGGEQRPEPGDGGGTMEQQEEHQPEQEPSASVLEVECPEGGERAQPQPWLACWALQEHAVCLPRRQHMGQSHSIDGMP